MAKFLRVSMFSLRDVTETLVRHRWLLLRLPSAAANKVVVAILYSKCALKARRRAAVQFLDEMK
jgi:hypothetical protein